MRGIDETSESAGMIDVGGETMARAKYSSRKHKKPAHQDVASNGMDKVAHIISLSLVILAALLAISTFFVPHPAHQDGALQGLAQLRGNGTEFLIDPSVINAITSGFAAASSAALRVQVFLGFAAVLLMALAAVMPRLLRSLVNAPLQDLALAIRAAKGSPDSFMPGLCARRDAVGDVARAAFDLAAKAHEPAQQAEKALSLTKDLPQEPAFSPIKADIFNATLDQVVEKLDQGQRTLEDKLQQTSAQIERIGTMAERSEKLVVQAVRKTIDSTQKSEQLAQQTGSHLNEVGGVLGELKSMIRRSHQTLEDHNHLTREAARSVEGFIEIGVHIRQSMNAIAKATEASDTLITALNGQAARQEDHADHLQGLMVSFKDLREDVIEALAQHQHEVERHGLGVNGALSTMTHHVQKQSELAKTALSATEQSGQSITLRMSEMENAARAMFEMMVRHERVLERLALGMDALRGSMGNKTDSNPDPKFEQFERQIMVLAGHFQTLAKHIAVLSKSDPAQNFQALHTVMHKIDQRLDEVVQQTALFIPSAPVTLDLSSVEQAAHDVALKAEALDRAGKQMMTLMEAQPSPLSLSDVGAEKVLSTLSLRMENWMQAVASGLDYLRGQSYDPAPIERIGWQVAAQAEEMKNLRHSIDAIIERITTTTTTDQALLLREVHAALLQSESLSKDGELAVPFATLAAHINKATQEIETSFQALDERIGDVKAQLSIEGGEGAAHDLADRIQAATAALRQQTQEFVHIGATLSHELASSQGEKPKLMAMNS
jgi:hypothetical protein